MRTLKALFSLILLSPQLLLAQPDEFKDKLTIDIHQFKAQEKQLLKAIKGNATPYNPAYIELIEDLGIVTIPDEHYEADIISFPIKEDEKQILELKKNIGINELPVGPSQIPDSVINQPSPLNDKTTIKELLGYLNSEDAKSCDIAASKIGSPSFEKITTQKTYRLYKDSCGVHTLNNYDSKYKVDIESRLAAFINDKHQVVCSGFLISDNTVITARHCFRNQKDKKELLGLLLVINNEQKTKTRKFKVRDSSCNKVHELINIDYLKSIQPCDYVLIDIETSKAVLATRFPITDAIEDNDKLIIIGYNYLNHGYEQKTNNATSLWIDGLTVSDHQMCIIYNKNKLFVNGVTQHCFTHGCQTIGGMSGAPVFIVKNDKVYFAGVHIGSTKVAQNSVWDTDTLYTCKSNNTNDFDNQNNNLAITASIN